MYLTKNGGLINLLRLGKILICNQCLFVGSLTFCDLVEYGD